MVIDCDWWLMMIDVWLLTKLHDDDGDDDWLIMINHDHDDWSMMMMMPGTTCTTLLKFASDSSNSCQFSRIVLDPT